MQPASVCSQLKHPKLKTSTNAAVAMDGSNDSLLATALAAMTCNAAEMNAMPRVAAMMAAIPCPLATRMQAQIIVVARDEILIITAGPYRSWARRAPTNTPSTERNRRITLAIRK